MKILLLRFSSIGDIVLTTPVIRCVKQQLPDAEIHFLTKSVFHSLLEKNPYLSKIYCFSKDTGEIVAELKKEKYDLVIDLHKNFRTAKLKATLFRKSVSFNKINLEKWLAVNTGKKSFLPQKHIVDRYFEGIKKLGIKNDFQGLDFFLGEEDSIESDPLLKSGFIAFAIGAQFATKKMPPEKMISILQRIPRTVVLLGGKEDEETARKIMAALPQNKIYDYCGKLTIRQSAFILSKSTVVLTHDTGMMHIAAALKKPIVSVWGNTIPEFGMYPYLPGNENLSDIVQVENLNCRPCSKIGFQACPKKHFDCMRKQDENKILSLLEKRF